MLALSAAPVCAGLPNVSAMVAAVPKQALETDVLVIGENHRKAGSHAFTLGLIKRAISSDRCVHFALEIGADQTAAWQALSNKEQSTPAQLSTIHDSPSLRALLADTAELSRRACLRLAGVDVAEGQNAPQPGGRDAFMAEGIADLADPRVLTIALLGNNHAPRHVDWNFDEPGQSTTHYLDARGLDTFVIVQDWKADRRSPRMFTEDTPEAVQAFNTLQSHRSVIRAQSLSRYADVLIVWPEELAFNTP
ncbi:hypothetical protein J7355_16140 [Endozoicomonas sp. G2_2]|nr:hypothetical protein [Endozoicomonas sp. G2_2]